MSIELDADVTRRKDLKVFKSLICLLLFDGLIGCDWLGVTDFFKRRSFLYANLNRAIRKLLYKGFVLVCKWTYLSLVFNLLSLTTLFKCDLAKNRSGSDFLM